MVAKYPEQIDVLIIGGGPAGISASLWCSELGLSSIVLEKELEVGGQLLWTFNPVENYLGVKAANGRDLRNRFLEHLHGKHIQYLTGTNVADADLGEKIVTLDDGRSFFGRAMIIATGVRRRNLDVSGEQEFQNRGILSSGMKAIGDVKGKKILIIGGGDAALENAVNLSKKAARVFLVHRRSEFSARREFVELAERSPLITILVDHTITEIRGDNKVEAVEAYDQRSNTRCEIAVDHVLIRIGVVPNTELFRGQIELDDSGYIQVDAFGSTSLSGSYAAGDVASPNILNISNAVGQGTAVVRTIYKRRNSG
jgi:thioredoxin reductase (NADPH)